MFVPYLALSDYLPTIERNQLQKQILNELQFDGSRERKFAESWAIEKIQGKISDRYDLQYELTPTLPYDPTKAVYGANDRIILDFPEWEEGKSYGLDDCVVYEEKAYKNIFAGGATSFDPTHWILIGDQFDIFYIKSPYQRFSLEPKVSNGGIRTGYYDIGDKVVFGGRIWTALQPTGSPTRLSSIQYPTYSAIPSRNVFPSDSTLGKTYWRDEGIYEVANSLPTSSDWTKGDNRDSLMVQAVIDLSLWMLHKRISPNNIPELREVAKDMTFEWLSNLRNGNESSNLYQNQPSSGRAISWGSNPKNQNGYT